MSALPRDSGPMPSRTTNRRLYRLTFRLVAILAMCLLFTAVACNGDSDQGSAPSATSGPTGAGATSTPSRSTPTEPPAQAGTATPEPTSPAAEPITPENFGALEVVAEASLDGLQYVAWQEDGGLLVASPEHAVLIDPVTGDVESLHSPGESEQILAISGTGDIATAHADRMGVDVRDIAGDVRTSIDIGEQFGSVAFSPDGSLLATTRLAEIAVDIWSTASGERLHELSGFETAAPVYSASLGPDNQKVLWQSRATVQITELTSGEMTPPMRHELFVSNAAFSPDGSLLATTWAAFATLWDVETGRRIQNLDQTVPAFEPAFMPDADLLLVGSDDGVRLWDSETYQPLGHLQTAARHVAVSRDGSLLATVDQGGFVTIWAPSGS